MTAFGIAVDNDNPIWQPAFSYFSVYLIRFCVLLWLTLKTDYKISTEQHSLATAN